MGMGEATYHTAAHQQGTLNLWLHFLETKVVHIFYNQFFTIGIDPFEVDVTVLSQQLRTKCSNLQMPSKHVISV